MARLADNVPVNPSTSYTVAADEIGGIAYQRVKLNIGEDGVASLDVGPTTPLPISGTVQVSGPVQVSGTVTIAPTTLTVNTAGTITGASVTIQQGVSVTAAVSGTISVLNVVPVTTAVSVSVTGLPVWLNPTQPVVVNTIAAGFSVNALVTGAVSISAMPAVSISVSAVLGTIVTQLGTQMVSIAQTSVSVSVIPTINTITTILGTQMVSIAQTSVVAQVSGTVTVSNGATVNVSGILITTTGVTTGTAQAVWIMNPTTVTVTINGTTTGTVSLLSIVPVTTQASVSVSGIPVWFSPGAIVANSGLLFTTGVPTLASTGQIMVEKPVPAQPVQIVVPSTAIAQSANKYAFTIWTGLTGAPAAAGTTSWAVPAGRFLRLNNLQIAVTTSAVGNGSVQPFVGVGATASMVSASISTQLQLLKMQVFPAAALVSAAMMGASADVQAGESIAIFIAASTAAVMRDLVITGQLF